MKYELTQESVEVGNRKLYRIRALKDFGDVKAGDLGGFVESENNLSQEGSAWVYDKAKVYGEAAVYGEAKVYDEAQVYGRAKVYGRAQVFYEAQVFDKALVCDRAAVCDRAHVYDEAHVYGEAWVYGFTLYLLGDLLLFLDSRSCRHRQRHV